MLERVNLTVEPGELVCLLGPNGIGKSTLMRTLARMQPALWGSVELGGTALESLSASDLARRLGVVLTERVAVESLRARQIVELGRYPHSGWLGSLTDRDHEVVSWAIDAVGANHLADRDFARMSDGERQRVMVARALAQEPVLLVLDEPTAFLDVPSRVELMGLLRRLTRGGSLAVDRLDARPRAGAADGRRRLAAASWRRSRHRRTRRRHPLRRHRDGLRGTADSFPSGRTKLPLAHRRPGDGGRSWGRIAGRDGQGGSRAGGLRGCVVEPATAESLSLTVSEAGWHLSAEAADMSGDTFRSLAAHLRGLSDG